MEPSSARSVEVMFEGMALVPQLAHESDLEQQQVRADQDELVVDDYGPRLEALTLLVLELTYTVLDIDEPVLEPGLLFLDEVSWHHHSDRIPDIDRWSLQVVGIAADL